MNKIAKYPLTIIWGLIGVALAVLMCIENEQGEKTWEQIYNFDYVGATTSNFICNNCEHDRWRTKWETKLEGTFAVGLECVKCQTEIKEIK